VSSITAPRQPDLSDRMIRRAVTSRQAPSPRWWPGVGRGRGPRPILLVSSCFPGRPHLPMWERCHARYQYTRPA